VPVYILRLGWVGVKDIALLGDVRSGKVLGRPTVGQEKEAVIRAQLAQGFGLIKTAKYIGVGVSVVLRVRAINAA
jgi:hypothetical protein